MNEDERSNTTRNNHSISPSLSELWNSIKHYTSKSISNKGDDFFANFVKSVTDTFYAAITESSFVYFFIILPAVSYLILIISLAGGIAYLSENSSMLTLFPVIVIGFWFVVELGKVIISSIGIDRFKLSGDLTTEEQDIKDTEVNPTEPASIDSQGHTSANKTTTSIFLLWSRGFIARVTVLNRVQKAITRILSRVKLLFSRKNREKSLRKQIIGMTVSVLIFIDYKENTLGIIGDNSMLRSADWLFTYLIQGPFEFSVSLFALVFNYLISFSDHPYLIEHIGVLDIKNLEIYTSLGIRDIITSDIASMVFLLVAIMGFLIAVMRDGERESFGRSFFVWVYIYSGSAFIISVS